MMIRRTYIDRDGRRTSTRLEPEFWAVLDDLAAREGVTPATYVRRFAVRVPYNITVASALRVHLLQAVRRVAP